MEFSVLPIKPVQDSLQIGYLRQLRIEVLPYGPDELFPPVFQQLRILIFMQDLLYDEPLELPLDSKENAEQLELPELEEVINIVILFLLNRKLLQEKIQVLIQTYKALQMLRHQLVNLLDSLEELINFGLLHKYSFLCLSKFPPEQLKPRFLQLLLLRYFDLDEFLVEQVKVVISGLFHVLG